MSKFFYHGKANNNNERGNASFGGNKSVKLGTDKSPAMLSVQTEARQQELEAILAENKWVGEVILDKDADENISDLEILQNKPAAAQTTKKANRNDPCPCGSEKKYKKCCGQ